MKIGQQEEAKEATPEFVSATDFNAALEKQANDLRAAFGRDLKEIREALGSVKAPEDKGQKEPPKKEGVDAVMEAAQARLKQLDERDTKQRQKALRLAVRDALRDAGADPHLAELTVPAMLEREAGKFEVVETEYGDFKVLYGEAKADAGVWAKTFLGTPEGKRILSRRPAPNVPDASGVSTTSGVPGIKEVPSSLAHHLSDEQLSSGMYSIVPG